MDTVIRRQFGIRTSSVYGIGNNGVWESVKNTRKTKDIPEDENYSIEETEKKNIFGADATNYQDMSDDELFKMHEMAYKNKNKKIGKLVVREWQKRRGYNNKAYHGTNAKDDFTVADASGKFEKNGYGKRVYGNGFYMSETKAGSRVWDFWGIQK